MIDLKSYETSGTKNVLTLRLTDEEHYIIETLRVYYGNEIKITNIHDVVKHGIQMMVQEIKDSGFDFDELKEEVKKVNQEVDKQGDRDKK